MSGLIVFVGPGLDGLEHLAGRLRRFGVETAWIGYPFERRRVLRARLFCDHASSAGDAGELTAQLAALGPERLLDILCGERMLTTVLACAERVGAPGSVLELLRDRLRVADKWHTSRALAEAGVPVPRALDAGVVAAGDAAEQLGLPLVVKARIGMAGSGVRVVAGVAEAETAVTELSGHGGVFFEEFVADALPQGWSAAIAGDGTVLAQVCQRTTRPAADPLGPADLVHTFHAPELEAAGARAAAALGVRGLVDVDFMVGAQGPLMIDVNLRPWHSVVAMLEAGIDFVPAYLATLGLPGSAPGQVSVGRDQFGVFPRTSGNAFLRAPGYALGEWVRGARRYAGWVGPGYVVAAGFRTVGIVGAELVRRARRRRG